MSKEWLGTVVQTLDLGLYEGLTKFLSCGKSQLLSRSSCIQIKEYSAGALKVVIPQIVTNLKT